MTTDTTSLDARIREKAWYDFEKKLETDLFPNDGCGLSYIPWGHRKALHTAIKADQALKTKICNQAIADFIGKVESLSELRD